MAWRSRIVGHGKEDPEQLLANPFNWRIHPSFQQQSLEAAIENVGYIRSVTVNRVTGHIVDGHLRVVLALRRGEPDIDVEYVELTPHEELMALATVDPIAELAVTDAPKLAETLRVVNTDSPILQQFLSDLSGKAGLFRDPPLSLEDLEAEHGAPDDSDLWPVIRVKVSPDTHALYRSLLKELDGVDEADKFDTLVNIASAALAGTN
jgi:hypothetical protein